MASHARTEQPARLRLRGLISTRAARHRKPGTHGPLQAVACATLAITMADAALSPLVAGELAVDAWAGRLPAAQLTWISVINIAAVAGLLGAAGRWADALGRKLVLAAGVVLFGAGCVVVISATGWPVLLGGRLLQGTGSALMIPSSLALLLAELPAARRRGALAVWSGSSGLGVALAQTGGGEVIAAFGWRAAFVPAVVVAVLLLPAVAWLPGTRTRAARPALARTVVQVTGVAAVMWGLWHGGQWGWASPQTFGCGAVAGGASVMLLLVRRRLPAGAPRRAGWTGLPASALFGAVQYSVLVMAPLYLQQAHDLDPARAGWWMAAVSLAVLGGAPLAGVLGRRFGTAVGVYAGALAVVAGCTLLLKVAELSAAMVVALAVLGAGIGMLATATFTAGTLPAEPARFASAAGSVIAARMVGGAVGVAGSGVLVQRPVLAGPHEGFATVFAAVIAGAALLAGAAVCAGLRAAWTARLRRVPVLEQEVRELHRLLAELRTVLVQVRSEADAELSRLTTGARPASARPAHAPALPVYS